MQAFPVQYFSKFSKSQISASADSNARVSELNAHAVSNQITKKRTVLRHSGSSRSSSTRPNTHRQKAYRSRDGNPTEG